MSAPSRLPRAILINEDQQREMLTHCPICKEPLLEQVEEGEAVAISCRKCGRVRITGSAVEVLRDWNGNRPVLSGVCRYESDRGNVLQLRSDNIGEIVSQAPMARNPLQALENLLIYIGDRSENFSSYVQYNDDSLPITVTLDPNDFTFIWTSLRDMGYIEFANGDRLRLTVEGWRRYQELQTNRPKSDQVVVAMWFDPSVFKAWTEGIKPGIEDVGYTPVRLDELQHNEKIDDQIIVQIRRSGLVVADLTGGRPNVYFEAGFAMGLGIPVIWTCREDHLDDLHFDTRQYNYIGWETPAELRERLRLRIEATLPRKG